ncbi:hypothetical protein EI427_25100 [Flammeovirga pectinis]|uniref:PH domain-containing protein n=1 Tax=Flammeovirga pectinis TaxID=2494373 RepID=A0A3Q9FVH7_9BACT|nr:hypothetical protein [Flammeovirga pectinis]AZQ65493.1 hypothetical protein EI427_25100 [Flammeovirga pectinis]
MESIKILKISKWIRHAVAVLIFIIVLLGTLDLPTKELSKPIIVFGFFLAMLYQSKILWFKHYVEWNKNYIVIKVNAKKALNITFSDIQSSVLKKDKLFLTKKDKEEVVIDLKNIKREDAQKLHFIMMENAISNL